MFPSNKLGIMKFSLIGAGNLATRLGVAMVAQGCEVVDVWSRTEASARRLAQRLGCRATAALGDLSDEADVFIVSVRDDALPGLLPLLCRGRESKVFLHTAGSVAMNIFAPFCRHYGVFYPMQTFSKERATRFGEIPCFVEWSDDGAHVTVMSLAQRVGGSVHPLSSDDRRRLHLAAVFACNFANHCYAIAEGLLREVSVGFEVMLPLIDETACKVHELSPRKAQTGPAVRNDRTVIDRQSAWLSNHPDWQNIYAAMSDSIHRLATHEPENDQQP